MDDFPQASYDDLHDALEQVYTLSRLRRVKKDFSQRTNIRTRYKINSIKRRRYV